MWTITTDPKIMDPAEALATANSRWKSVHRELYRLYGKFRYFKVIELTASGLPHFHLLTDAWIDWRTFQSILVRFQFGEVLHFTVADRHRASRYVTKYAQKGLYRSDQPAYWPRKPYSAALYLLPRIKYTDPDGDWTLVLVDLATAPPTHPVYAGCLSPRDAIRTGFD